MSQGAAALSICSCAAVALGLMDHGSFLILLQHSSAAAAAYKSACRTAARSDGRGGITQCYSASERGITQAQNEAERERNAWQFNVIAQDECISVRFIILQVAPRLSHRHIWAAVLAHACSTNFSAEIMQPVKNKSCMLKNHEALKTIYVYM